MTLEKFIEMVNDKQPPAPESELLAFEKALGARLPDDYREFLIECNGGFLGGMLWFVGPTPTGEKADAGVHHIGGFRQESYFSLIKIRSCYEGRIPDALLWIMDDPFGNAICLGLQGESRGRVYFWDHENEPEGNWDGKVDSGGDLQILANTFTEFVAGLQVNES
ncbi:MAG: SMI1/KNR4 family protein [Alphaproteobacteria bacterium]|nr:SMI1/KNR4 family protein [Alphaproteobacteria bacterium]